MKPPGFPVADTRAEPRHFECDKGLIPNTLEHAKNLRFGYALEEVSNVDFDEPLAAAMRRGGLPDCISL
jgi:hypothetical protein